MIICVVPTRKLKNFELLSQKKKKKTLNENAYPKINK